MNPAEELKKIAGDLEKKQADEIFQPTDKPIKWYGVQRQHERHGGPTVYKNTINLETDNPRIAAAFMPFHTYYKSKEQILKNWEEFKQKYIGQSVKSALEAEDLGYLYLGDPSTFVDFGVCGLTSNGIAIIDEETEEGIGTSPEVAMNMLLKAQSESEIGDWD